MTQSEHGALPYQDISLSIAARVRDLLGRMTLAEKIGQMTLVEKNSIDPQQTRDYHIGAILSGGGGNPANNSPLTWHRMVRSYLEAARQTRLGIPLIYGVDAVHGHSNVVGAVIFPHNIGLGAAADPELVKKVAHATAVETYATGIRWNYAPTVAVPQDYRWGRVYEGFGQDTSLVTRLAGAYVEGLQGDDLAAAMSVLATPKHYLGDGGTTWDTSTKLFPPVEAAGIAGRTRFYIDQGDTRLDEETLRAIHLPPYAAAVRAGAQVVMASFSSWNGHKMHAHHYLLTDVLKGELAFPGFIVSDWGGIEDAHEDPYQAVVDCVNAGVDMNMVPFDYLDFLANLRKGIDNGDIPISRIDDAVARILSVKMQAGLFDQPDIDDQYLSLVGSPEHRQLAREAVARSLVLLKNDGELLPLPKSLPTMLVAGDWADDIGLQCGGWTIEWLGGRGPITAGTSILDAIRATVSPQTRILHHPQAVFSDLVAESGKEALADVGLVFLGELPYAEGFGDEADLTLGGEQIAVLERMRPLCHKLVLVLVTGRPLIISEQLPLADALVVAWLPGSEGQGVADVLFGDVSFSGTLSYPWPRSMDQIPLSYMSDVEPLFPIGFGLA